MNDVKNSRRVFGGAEVAATLLFAAALPVQATYSICGGGDCCAIGTNTWARTRTSISSGSCYSIGAKHKWFESSSGGSSTIGYNRAHD